MNQLTSLTDRLQRLLVALERGDHPGRARFEETLTDGYAWALKLDAECTRLERSIAQLAAHLGAGSNEVEAHQLSNTARQLEDSRRELHALRSLLASLRAQFAEAKVA